MADSATTIGTLEYKVEASANSAISALDKLEAKLTSIAGVLSSMPHSNSIFKGISEMSKGFDSAANSAKKLSKEKVEPKVDFSQFKDAEDIMERVADKVKGFGNYIPINFGDNYASSIKETSAAVDALSAKLQEMVANNSSSEAIEKVAIELQEASNALGYMSDEAERMNAELEEAAANNFTPGLDDMETAYDPEKIADGIAATTEEMERLQESEEDAAESADTTSDRIGKIGGSARRSAKEASGGFRDFIKTLKNIGSHVSNFGKRISNIFGGGGRRGLLGNRSLGQFIGLIVFRRLITSALRALTAGIKEGSDNLTQYSASYNAAISGITSSLNFLKNAWAAGFAPIVEVVAPYLQAFVDMIANALNAVGRFMAALTGKGFAVQAVKVFSDYAKGLKGTGSAASGAKKSLDEYKKTILSFDELHVLNDTNDRASGGGGGGGGGGANTTPISDMFTTVEVDADSLGGRIRQMILDSNWEGVGQTIAEKLAEQLGGIPWDDIKKKAGDIGGNLAEFFNGVAREKSLWRNLGTTFSEGLNTALTFANSFLKKGDFTAYGNAIGTFIGQAIADFDWKLAGGSLGLAVTKLFNFLNGLMKGIDWKKLGQGIKDGIKEFFANIEWGDIGRTARTAFEALLDFVISVLPTPDEWKGIGEYLINAIVDGIVGFADGNNSVLGYKIAAALLRVLDTAWHVMSPHLTAIEWLANAAGYDFEIPGFGTAANALDKKANEIAAQQKQKKPTWLNKAAYTVSVRMDKKSQKIATLYNETKVGGKSTVGVNAWQSPEFKDAATRYEMFRDRDATVTAYGRTSSSYTGLEQSYSSGVWTKYNTAVKTLEGATSKSYTDHETKFKNFGKDHFDAVKTIKGKIADSFTTTKSKFDAVADKTATAKASAQDTQGTVKKVSDAYSKLFDKNVKVSAYGQMTIENVGWTQQAVLSVKKLWGMTKANGGIFMGGGWQDITKYASGGLPYSGEMFIAREAGPELVGTIGGHTAVMNNDQIVASVAAGVYNAVVRANAMNGQSKVYIPEITLRTENNEVLARAVMDGEASLGYRS